MTWAGKRAADKAVRSGLKAKSSGAQALALAGAQAGEGAGWHSRAQGGRAKEGRPSEGGWPPGPCVRFDSCRCHIQYECAAVMVSSPAVMSLIVRPPCAMACRCASLAVSRYEAVRFAIARGRRGREGTPADADVQEPADMNSLSLRPNVPPGFRGNARRRDARPQRQPRAPTNRRAAQLAPLGTDVGGCPAARPATALAAANRASARALGAAHGER